MRGTLQGGPDQISEATLGSLIRLRDPSSLRGRDPRVVGVFGVADLACDLGDRRVPSCYGSRASRGSAGQPVIPGVGPLAGGCWGLIAMR